MGLTIKRGEGWLVGGDYFYAFVANFCPCKSSRRRHVAGAVRHSCALERLGTNSTFVEKPRSGWSVVGDLEIALPYLLSRTRAGLSGQRPNCVDAAAHGRGDDYVVAGLAVGWRFRFLPGILLTLGVVALWGIPALIRTDGQFFSVGIGRHVIGRSFATMEGHGANSIGMYLLLLPFYFVTVFVSFFPWSIKLPWLVRTLWREKKTGLDVPGYNGNKIDVYFVIGFAIIFIIFTL